jgi:ribose transport system ATP-binding protein
VPLCAKALGRRYGATLALSDATLELRRGEVLGLVGQNGSGKSTLLRLLGGIERPDKGTVLWGDQPAPVGGLRESVRRGVVLVFQELALLGNLRVFESFFLPAPELSYRRGVQRRRWMRERCREACARHGLMLDPDRAVGELPFGTRQLLEVIRALELPRLLGHVHPTVLLDEPTSALDHHEIERLSRLIDEARGKASFVFVSHRLGEVVALCDRVVVMREGETVAELVAGELREQQLHELMVGHMRRSAPHGARRRAGGGGYARLELSGAGGEGFHDISLKVDQGEIVGLAGVEGSGKSELCEAVYGLRRLRSGRMRLGDEERKRPRPSGQAARNVAYLPKERSAGGIIESASVARHVGLHMMRTRLFTDASLELDLARVMMERFEVQPPDPGMLVGVLSGGNQQKVALGKWMVDLPDLLVLDNPTRGVDIQARGVIHREIRKAVSRGSSVLMAGDELDELLALCDTIHVMRDGSISYTLDVTALSSRDAEAEHLLIGQML